MKDGVVHSVQKMADTDWADQNGKFRNAAHGLVLYRFAERTNHFRCVRQRKRPTHAPV